MQECRVHSSNEVARMSISLPALASAARHPRRTLRRLRDRWLVPAGYGAWRPLVPEEEYLVAVRGAVTRLLRDPEAQPVGDYLEFGVSRGTSMACMHQVLKEHRLSDTRLIGFDSFEGMPKGSEAEGWREGQYHSTLGATRRYLAGRGVDLGRVKLVKGWFDTTCNPETRAALNLSRVSLLMLDCDTYSSTNVALDFALPLVGDRAVLIFDDWGARADKGEIGQKDSFDERVIATGAFDIEELAPYGRAKIFHLSRR